jgi:peptidyl-prolyl cis-trans isomerase A (cyclophilin A)
LTPGCGKFLIVSMASFRTFLPSLLAFGLVVAAVVASVAGTPGAKAPANETAPAVFRVNFSTSRGPVVVEITRAQSPHGADRIFNLVKTGYFDGARFYRVVPGFIVQFGGAADPRLSKAWDVPIPDDPVKGTNARGVLTFAMAGPDSRTTQFFINLADNAGLDGMGFAPLGRVLRGMENVDKIYSGDGENPDQGVIYEQGNAYLQKAFPHLDAIVTARLAP